METCISAYGRRFSTDDVELICGVVRSCGGLSRTELARTISELLEWKRPNGGLKGPECRKLLERLEAQGRLRLPPLRSAPQPRRHAPASEASPSSCEALETELAEIGGLNLRVVDGEADRRQWRDLVDRHHYLGCRVPFGAHLRYLIEISSPRLAVVACLQFSSPAWRLGARDQWIGWSDDERRRGLQRIVCNSRFLVLPSVRVRNLASRILSLASHCVTQDWAERYGLRPLLIETLVDPSRYQGTCYRAANWIEVGSSSGRGRMDREHRRHGAAPKRVFVYPLDPQWRERLRRA